MGVGLGQVAQIREEHNIDRGNIGASIARSAAAAARRGLPTSSGSVEDRLAATRPSEESEIDFDNLSAEQAAIVARVNAIGNAARTLSLQEARAQLRLDTLKGEVPLDAPVLLHAVPYPQAGWTDYGYTAEDTILTVEESLNLFLEGSSADQEAMQLLMFSAGYYPKDTELEDIDFGAPGKSDYDAWRKLVEANARQYAADAPSTVPLFDYLSNKAFEVGHTGPEPKGGSGRRRSGGGGGGGGGGAAAPPLVVRLSDPAAIQLLSQNFGQQVLGRRLTTEEQQRLVAMVHDDERIFQQRQYDMALTGESGEIIQPDISARIEQGVREGAPIEAGGKQIADQFNNFRQMILGGI